VLSQKRLAAVVAALLVLSGCLASTPDSPAPQAEAQAREAGHFADPSVFTVGFDRIQEVYLVKEDFGKLALDGLNGLSKLDDTLSVRRDGGQVQLIRAGHIVGVFDSPGPDASYDWGTLVASTLDSASLTSPKIATAGSEAAYQAVYDALLADLDPFSRYANPDRARDDRAQRDGYTGVGIALSQDDKGRPVIGDVFPDTPAARANLLKGSLIVAVDGVSVEDAKVDEIADLMRGPVDTKVDLTVREPKGSTRTATMTRQKVIENMARSEVRDNVIIVKLLRYNKTSAEAIRNAVTGLLHGLNGKARGIVLDLRGNPGGLLDQSTTLADLFMDRGPIVSTRGRDPDSEQNYSANDGDIARHLPLAVLIDGHSASAAEVTAAALQDSGRAILVGSTSFGKGSVQTVTRLPNDGELFLTWSRIYAPSGYTWHRQGILPTVCTSGSGTDAKAMIEAFRTGQLPSMADAMAERFQAPDDETALRRVRAACPWQVHDAGLDVDVAIGLISDPTLYAQALGSQDRGTVAIHAQ
jgi:carboxyl-terminal processing protease